MHRTDKYSDHSSIICPVWPNGWVIVYKLNCFGFESSCSHLNFRFRACFEQGVLWHSGNYTVCIHSKTRTWRDKNIQSKRCSILSTDILSTFVHTRKIILNKSCFHSFLRFFGTVNSFIWIKLVGLKEFTFLKRVTIIHYPISFLGENYFMMNN